MAVVDVVGSSYNGLNWRTMKQVDTDPQSPPNEPDQLRMLYYTNTPGNSQLVEERVDNSFTYGTDDPDPHGLGLNDEMIQHFWGLRYIDDALASRYYTLGRALDYGDLHYNLTDAQFSTVAVIDETARLDERVAYDPYGQARHQYLRDVDGDGDGNDTDDTDLIDDALDFDIEIFGTVTYFVTMAAGAQEV